MHKSLKRLYSSFDKVNFGIADFSYGCYKSRRILGYKKGFFTIEFFVRKCPADNDNLDIRSKYVLIENKDIVSRTYMHTGMLVIKLLIPFFIEAIYFLLWHSSAFQSASQLITSYSIKNKSRPNIYVIGRYLME